MYPYSPYCILVDESHNASASASTRAAELIYAVCSSMQVGRSTVCLSFVVLYNCPWEVGGVELVDKDDYKSCFKSRSRI